jgi:tetratricopeptide (TPR) repeat protein
LSLTYACQGKYDLALTEIKRASDLFDNKEMPLLYEGNLHFLTGDFSRAEKVYLEMAKAESPRPRFQGKFMLGNLYISKGEYEKAKKEIDKALEEGEDVKSKLWIQSSKVIRAYADIEAGNVQEGLEYFNNYWNSLGSAAENNGLYLMWKVIFSLKDKEVEVAGKALEGYKEAQKTKSNVRATKRNTLYLQGAVELTKQNYSEAITLLEEGVSLLPFQHYLGFETSGVLMIRATDPHCMFMSLLALAYYQKGDLDRAQDVYEKITNLTTGRLWDGDKYAKAFYMLGKIYEQRGWPGKGIENYERFLDLWKDADPGLSEVEDAKKRLEQLKN